MTDDLYKEVILEAYASPMNRGELAVADAVVPARNASCGDELTVFLSFDQSQCVRDIKWRGEGCAISIAAASVVSEYVKGKTLDQVLALTQQDVEGLLGLNEISPGRKKCLMLALSAVQHGAKEHRKKSTHASR